MSRVVEGLVTDRNRLTFHSRRKVRLATDLQVWTGDEDPLRLPRRFETGWRVWILRRVPFTTVEVDVRLGYDTWAAMEALGSARLAD